MTDRTPVGPVASFDVFDTVLTRVVGDPDGVLVEVGRELARAGKLPCSAAVLTAERRHQERRLNRLLGRHADLREIWSAAAEALGVPSSTAAGWAAAEEDLERRLVVALPSSAALLDDARARGREVVFVSDTPHSESFVAELLETRGLKSPQERVFTSSARRASKSSGGLFGVVEGELGRGRRFTHVGDNEAGDLAAPRAEGWHSALATGGRLTRYERILESHAEETDGFTSWLAGASRIARLEAQERGVAAPLAAVASGSMAPMLVGYALWVLGQARARGLRRLYFVARDGRVMLDVARPLLERLAPDLELRYLHGSRHPWTLGAAALSEDVRRRWTRTKAGHTARTALTRLGLTPEEVQRARAFPFTAPERTDQLLTAEERAQLDAALTEEPLLSAALAAARQQAELTSAYLRQEGFADDVPSALVDAGWGGRTAQALDLLVEHLGGPPVDHLVVGITGNAEDLRNREGVRMVPWLFDEQAHPASLSGLRSPNVLIEMFCADTTGRTMGYARSGGRLVPVLDPDADDAVSGWGLPALQSVAVRVAELVVPRLAAQPPALDTARFTREVLRAFWVTPSRAEVKAWGDFPWEEEVAEPYAPIAQRITTRSVLARLSRGDARLRSPNAWRAGSARISPQPWRGLLLWRAWVEDNQERTERARRRVRLAVAKRRPQRRGGR